jgi:hypothetical protein
MSCLAEHAFSAPSDACLDRRSLQKRVWIESEPRELAEPTAEIRTEAWNSNWTVRSPSHLHRRCGPCGKLYRAERGARRTRNGNRKRQSHPSDARARGARRLAVGLLQGCGARSRTIPCRGVRPPRRDIQSIPLPRRRGSASPACSVTRSVTYHRVAHYSCYGQVWRPGAGAPQRRDRGGGSALCAWRHRDYQPNASLNIATHLTVPLSNQGKYPAS